ncbi:hypothetical protein H8E77_27825 [bacterium]|nr:hypothetical protein [bacterium]
MAEIKETLKKKLFHLDVLMEKQEDVFTAHCLQFDIVTEGNTIAEAEEMIVDAIFEYITFALEHNFTQFLFNPAPPEDWQKLIYSCSEKHLKLDQQDGGLPLVAEIIFTEVGPDA